MKQKDMENGVMDYKTCWDAQIVALEQQHIWFDYNIRQLRYLDCLANSYLSKCVKSMLRSKGV